MEFAGEELQAVAAEAGLGRAERARLERAWAKAGEGFRAELRWLLAHLRANLGAVFVRELAAALARPAGRRHPSLALFDALRATLDVPLTEPQAEVGKPGDGPG